MSDTDNRSTALITGGTSGIGFAIAQRLIKTSNVALLYRSNEERARSAQATLRLEAPAAIIQTYACDVTDDRVRSTCLEKINLDFGQAPSIFVHCAGTVYESLFMLSDMQKNLSMLDEHCFAAMKLTHALLPDMCRGRFGRIIFMSSVVAERVRPGLVGYATAKAALEGFTRALAIEVARRGVTINTIAPGRIETPLTQGAKEREQVRGREITDLIPSGRIGEVDDIASCVEFLCSPQASYITGTIIPIDGGLGLGSIKGL
jgi:3-oxoacyl-[acyl-carrier protein] reductase